MTPEQQALVLDNRGLVGMLAKRYWHVHAIRVAFGSFADCEQAGMVGLCKAALRFDPARGFKFCTFAFYCIRQEILNARQHSLVHIPMHAVEALGKRETKRRLSAVDTENAELAHRAQLIKQMPAYSDGEERPVPSGTPEPDELAEPAEAVRELRRLLAMLPEIDRFVLLSRYGVGRPECTLQDIALEVGLTRERIRQIENRAFARLRAAALREQISGERQHEWGNRFHDRPDVRKKGRR